MGRKRWLVVAVLLLLFPVMVFGLTLDDVIKLKELGIDEATIITKVKESGMHFTLGAADLARLKKAGASDALIAAMGAVKTTKGPVSNIMFIFDCSGSMMEKTTDGQYKIVAAKQAFGDLVNKLSADLEVGIVAFGHKNPVRADKDGIEVLRKLGPFDKAEMALAIAKLVPRGRTPIAASLLVAAEQLLNKGGKGSIVLISDGKESAGGNPIEVARMLRDKHGIDFGIYVVGFGVSDAERGQLERIAKAGGGDYFHATDAKSLAKSFEKVAEVAVQAKPLEKKKDGGRQNLLLQKNGGHLVLGSQPEWTKVNDGNAGSSFYTKPKGAQGVFAFKGDQVATIDSVAVYTPSAHPDHLKELEILVSTKNPLDGFTSLGVVKLVNAFMYDGFQKFKFDPVKAKYIKFKPISSHGGAWVTFYELQVWGEVDKEQPATAQAKGPAGRELLCQKNGGHLVLGSIPEWKNANDGNPGSNFYMKPNSGQGVFAFNGNQIATINAVGVYIPNTYHENVKDLDILVSTESPVEGFTSIAVVKPVNALMGDGFQIFTFNPVKAKYVKFVPLSSHDNVWAYFYELRIWGEIDKEQPTTTRAKGPTGQELLCQKNGGHLVLGSIPEWKNANDGNPGSYVYMKPEGAQGVFGFRGEGVATINAVGVHIASTYQDNIKELEVLVSMESPVEGFTSVGVVKTVNALMGKDGFQVFTFKPVKAKYVKFVPRSSHGGAWVYFYELRVWGTLD